MTARHSPKPRPRAADQRGGAGRRAGSPAEPRPRGRPRSAAAHDAILGAAIELIREVGYDAVTMDGVATRAGVGKATVYRRWKTREALVADAIGRIVQAMTVPDTGSVEGDLLVLLRGNAMLYADPASRALLSGLVAAMARSAPIAAAVRSSFMAARHAAMRRILDRGVARGELRRGLDVELALALLNGAPFYRYLMAGDEVDDRLVRGTVRVVVRGLAP